MKNLIRKLLLKLIKPYLEDIFAKHEQELKDMEQKYHHNFHVLEYEVSKFMLSLQKDKKTKHLFMSVDNPLREKLEDL